MTWRLETIGEAVADELRRFGPAGAIAEIVSAWPDAVGPAIAENAWPARCGRGGTVTVTTSSSVWAFELTKLEDDVRGRLAERLDGKAPRLRFVVGRLPERGGEQDVPSSSRAVPEVTREHRRAGEEIAASVRNEELRLLVARAAAASLARAAGEARDRPLW